MVTTCISDSKNCSTKMWCWDDPANCHSCIKQHDGQHWSKQPNDHFLSYWVHTNKEVVQETFYASHKHIFIQCSHHTQKERRRQIECIEFLLKIGRTNCWEVWGRSKIIRQTQRGETQFRRKPLLSYRKTFLDTNSTYQ